MSLATVPVEYVWQKTIFIDNGIYGIGSPHLFTFDTDNLRFGLISPRM